MNFEKEISAFLKRHHFERITPTVALIDMDGTLYDSMKGHTLAWHQLFLEMGIDIPQNEFYLYEGMTGEATIKMLLKRERNIEISQAEAVEIYARKTELFRQLPPVEIMPGAANMVESMKKMGMARVLVTGSGQASLIDRLNADFDNSFDEHLKVTSHDVTHCKPHPEPYIKGMMKAGMGPKKCIAVENAPLGVKSADSAGAFTIGVTTGPIPRIEMEKAGAAIVFNSMTECAENFPELIYQIFNTSSQNVVI